MTKPTNGKDEAPKNKRSAAEILSGYMDKHLADQITLHQADATCVLEAAQIAKATGISKNGKAAQPPQPLTVMTMNQLGQAIFRPKEPLVITANGYPVFHMASINEIHAYRGVGKTNLGFGLGHSLATGSNFLAWRVPVARRVLYVDGEMPGADVQAIRNLLVGDLPEEVADNFKIVTPEAQPSGSIPLISTPVGRELIERAMIDHKAEVMFLDSISSLANIPTNDEEQWLAIVEWFRRLRTQYGIALFYDHHDGKSGQQRGHSKSEDPADKVVHLVHESVGDGVGGLKFILQFEKARQPIKEDNCLRVALVENMGRAEWVYEVVKHGDVKQNSKPGPKVDPKKRNELREKVRELRDQGVGRNQIANRLDKATSTIDTLLKELEREDKVLEFPGDEAGQPDDEM